MALNFLNNGYFAAKVGIGTESPGTKLHVKDGSSGFTGTFDARNKSIVEANGEAYFATYVPDNSFSGLRFFNSTALKGFIDYYHGTQGDALVYSATGYHKFITSGTEKVRIINNGNVGIGTDSPLVRLQVGSFTGTGGFSRGTTSTIYGGFETNRSTLFIGTTDASAGDTGGSIALGGQTGSSSNMYAFGSIIGAKEEATAGYAGYLGFKTTPAASNLTFERMRISSTGAIKFNAYDGTNQTGTPTYILGTTNSGDIVKVLGANIPGVPGGSGTLRTIPMWTPDGDTLGNSNITQDTNLITRFGKTATTATAVASINHASNDFLYINGGTAGTAIGDDNQSTRIVFYNDDYIRFDTAGAEKMRIDASGRVGVGVVPEAWTVFTPIQVGQASSFVGRTSSNQTDVATNWYYNGAEKRIASGYAQRYTQTADGEHQFFTAGTDGADSAITFSQKLTIKNNGNVGIGTTTPLVALSIGSGSLADGNVPVQISTSGGTSQRWFGVNKNGSYGLLMGYLNGGSIGDGGAGAYIRNITEDPLYFMVSNSDLAMTIISNKNVGIGTATPVAKFEVTDGSSSITLQEYTNGAAIFLDGVNGDFVGGDYFHILANGNSYLGLGGYGGGSTPLNIANTGKVGIGVTNPQDFNTEANNLVIGTGSGAEGMTIYGGSSGGSYIYFADGTSGSDLYEGFLQYRHSERAMRFGVATGVRMTLNSNGYLGIGTTSPNKELTLGGAAGTQTLSFTTSAYLGDQAVIGNIEFSTHNADASYKQLANIYALKTGTNQNSGSLTFWTKENGGRGEKMRIAESGNVGIGITTPTAKLHVVGTGLFTGLVSGITPVAAANFVTKAYVDGSGGGTGPFLPLTGGTMTGVAGVVFPDAFKLNLGTGSDLEIYHNGTTGNNNIDNISGDLYISQYANDKDIIFRSDDGSGGVAEYFRLDGSVAGSPYVYTKFPDYSVASFGNGNDLQIYHNSNDSYIVDTGTGDLRLVASATKIYDADMSHLQASFTDGGSVDLYYGGNKKFETTSAGVSVTGDIQIDSALLSNQENTDVDTGTETVASVAVATYTAAFFDFVIKKTTNVRSGTVYACHDGTNVEFTETSTQDLGDTSDVTLSVDISGGNMRLRATTTSDNWSVKSLIRAI